MTALGDYLRAAAAPRKWGVVPCAVFAADWVVLCGHPDPLAFMREDTEKQAMRRLVKAGGMLPLAQRGMLEALVPEADEPRMGDVAVIERPTADGANQACAIYGGERWISLGLVGLDSGPGAPLMIWRPDHG